MEVKKVPLADLHLDPANVRSHPERNIKTIAASLARFGQQTPIVVDKANVIRKGNGTYLAAEQLGWTELDVVQTDLDGVEVTAYAIADNRSGELAEWHFEDLALALGALQDDGFDLAVIGWEPNEVDPLLRARWEPEPVRELDRASPDDGQTVALPHASFAVAFSEEQWTLVEKTLAIVNEQHGGGVSTATAVAHALSEWLGEGSLLEESEA